MAIDRNDLVLFAKIGASAFDSGIGLAPLFGLARLTPYRRILSRLTQCNKRCATNTFTEVG